MQRVDFRSESLTNSSLQNLQDIKTVLQKDNPPQVIETLDTNYPLPFAVLEVEEDGEKPFLLCQHNRIDDETYRSPWTNKMYTKDGTMIKTNKLSNNEDDDLRQFETQVNDVWLAYKNLYYGHDSVGSVYLQESDKGAFQGVFGIHKELPTTDDNEEGSSWDCISHVHVDEPDDKTCNYKVETSVVMVLRTRNGEAKSTTTASSSVSKTVSKTLKVSPNIIWLSHTENIGTLIEANEIDLRSNLERVYLPKTRETIDDIQKKAFRIPAQANPLMGMIMGSDMLKKKLAANGGGD